MIVLLLFLQLFTILYWLIKQHYSYWINRNFPCDHEIHILYGTLKSVVKGEKSIGVAFRDIYLKSNLPFEGIYLFYRPAVLIRDPQLAQQILIQDFDSFHARSVYLNEKGDPLSCNLFSLNGQKWRSLSQKLTSIFSLNKLKAMFTISDDVGNRMVAYLNKILPEDGFAELDLNEIFVTYSIDILGSVVFGLDVNSYEDPTNKFQSLVRTVSRNDLMGVLMGLFEFLCPTPLKFLALFGLKNKTAIGLREIIKEIIEYREKHNITRKDMLQLMMQLRNIGKLTDDDEIWSAKPNTEISEQKEFTLDHIAAQGFIFYVIGHETISSIAAFTIFELAQNAKLLTRVQKEVDKVLKRHNGQLSFDALLEMAFLEMCLRETNRKYPIPFLNRECTETYVIPGTKCVIEKGTPIIIPLLGIHRDKKYFKNPMTYDPDRFLTSNQNYNAQAYMPFGAGPRQCIALRMGMLNTKLAVVKILQNFNIELISKREIIIDNYSLGIQPKGGIKLKFSKRPEMSSALSSSE